MTEFGIWVGGMMAKETGADNPIARNTMCAELVRAGQRTHGDSDLIVLAVPAGEGNAFFDQISEALGGSKDTGEVVL